MTRSVRGLSATAELLVYTKDSIIEPTNLHRVGNVSFFVI